MQDPKLKELVEEVNRCNTNFNQADKAIIDIATYELMAAEKRLNLYIKERKELVKNGKNSNTMQKL